jgi:hypothetical protein
MLALFGCLLHHLCTALPGKPSEPNKGKPPKAPDMLTLPPVNDKGEGRRRPSRSCLLFASTTSFHHIRPDLTSRIRETQTRLITGSMR